MLTTLNTIPGHVRVRTVASRIGGEDGGKAALDALFGHDPSLIRVIVEILCFGGA